MSSFRISWLLFPASVFVFSFFCVLPPPHGHAQSVDHMVITEVMYDPFGQEPAGEWVEVFNPTDAVVDLTGWSLADNATQDAIPGFVLGPGEYLVIASQEVAFRSVYPDYTGHLVALEGPIGNGLGNASDRVLLYDASGQLVDAMSYGEDITAFVPPCPDVPEGRSLARVPTDRDTDTAADWAAQEIPNPGAAGTPPAATPTPTTTPSRTPTATPTLTRTPYATLTPTPTVTKAPAVTGTPTATPTPTGASTSTATATAGPVPTHTSTAAPSPWPQLLLSEVLYDAPQSGADSAWEWIEVYNPGDQAVALVGWRIGDNTAQDVIPAFELPAGDYLVIAATLAGFVENHPGFIGHLVTLEEAIGNGLSNIGDVVRLMAPDGAVIDAMSYGADTTAFNPPCPGVLAGQSLARVPSWWDTDTAADWVVQSSPNPGGPGVPLAATPTPTSTPTRGLPPTFTPTATSRPMQPGVVVINEIMQNPGAVLDENGEWFEIYNATSHAIDLNGWTLKDDGTDRHAIANGGPLWLPAGGFLVLGRNRDPAKNGGVSVAYQYTGFTLGNADDEIILLDAAGVEIDRVAYDGGPTFPDPTGASMMLIRPDADNNVGSNWRAAIVRWPDSAGDAGSPGATNHTAQIQGYVFEDRNGNGHRDFDELGLGIAGVLMTLRSDMPTGITHTLRTFPSGWYGFYDLPAGAYQVLEAQPAGFLSTTPDQAAVTLAPGEISLGPNFGELRLTPTPTRTLTAPSLLLSEVLYDAPQSGTDSAWEWIEVFNPGEQAVALAGWRVGDNTAQDVIPAFELPAGDYLVIAATLAGFMENHPGFTGRLVTLEDAIGNGLSNAGDVVRLIAPDGAVMDAMSYGANTEAFVPPCPAVLAGQSLARAPSWADTDTAADWVVQAWPNPGAAGVPPAATPTPTASCTLDPTHTPTAARTATATSTSTPTPMSELTGTPTASRTPTATPLPSPTLAPELQVKLNELLPRPDAVDWDGDGVVNAYDEWIEIYNFDSEAVDLGGWVLDDILGGGSAPYTLPAGTILMPGGFLVRYRSTTGVALNQDADTAHLIAPDGRVADSFSYRNPRRDVSYSRATDGIGEWTEAYPPSPGGPNIAPTVSQTPTPSPAPTASLTVTPTPIMTAVIYDPMAVRLNEVLPAPGGVDWDGDGQANFADEWIEIVSLATTTVDLSGWLLDDVVAGGSRPYTFPVGTQLSAGSFLVVYRSASGVALNNDEDTVRLLGPDGTELDVMTYSNPRADCSYSRITDGTGLWTDAYPPSPGRPNIAATPTPTATATLTVTPTQFPPLVTLNEILPNPQAVDWDGNGVTSFLDEWIELYNASSAPAAVGGWVVADDTKSYTLPPGTMIWPASTLLLFRSQTGLALGDNRDTVSLLRPDGYEADHYAYATGPGADRSYCRAEDGSGYWTHECYVTPGRPNQLLPATPDSPPGSAPTATPAGGTISIAAARVAPLDTRVTVTGAVTYPPGLLLRTIYIEDTTGGIKVYLRAGHFPALAVGDTVRVTGWLRSFHGEAELSAPNPTYLVVLAAGAGAPLLPQRISTGSLAEALEGRYVWLAGRVIRYEPRALLLDDGTGPARVYFPEDLPWRRPYVQIGQTWAATGVVGQYVYEPPYVGGYRLVPRFGADVSSAPVYLPVTGGGYP